LATSAPSDLDNRLRLTLRLVAACRHAGRAEEAWHVCQTAAGWARGLGRSDILAEAALTWGAEFSAGVVDSRHVAMLEEALQGLPSGDSALRARVLARLAAAQQPAVDPSGPVAMAREAVAMVGRLRDTPARLPVLNSASAAVLCYVPPDERLLLDEAQALDRLAVHAGRPLMITLVGYAMWDLADRILLRLASFLERWSEVDRHARAGQGLAARLGARPFAARLCLDWATSLRSRGVARADDRERALALARRARADGEELAMPGLVAAADAFLAHDRTASRSSAHAEVARASRDGEDWLFHGAGDTCRLRDCRGAQILAELLARPGSDIHVLDLVAARTASDARVDAGDAGEILDAEARRSYRDRLAEIGAELAEAESWNDTGRTGLLTEEAAQLRHALAEAVGLGGRRRRAGEAAERARVNVQRRLADALRRIGNMAPTWADTSRSVSARAWHARTAPSSRALRGETCGPCAHRSNPNDSIERW
jgi:hypothetical protein